jgi:hypothetical protein
MNKAVVIENGQRIVVNQSWVDFWRRVGANPRGLRVVVAEGLTDSDARIVAGGSS